MKRNLSLASYITLGLIIFNQILVMSLCKTVFHALNPKEEGMPAATFFLIISLAIFLIGLAVASIVLIAYSKFTTKFVASILMITLGILLILSIFLFTWIFGVPNIILGITSIVFASFFSKESKEEI